MRPEERYNSCGCRVCLRVIWTAIEWLANLLFILNIEDISDGKYSSRIVRDSELLTVLYIILFALKSIFWFYSFYRVIYNKSYLSVKSRVLYLWTLSITSAILAMIMMRLERIQENPLFFIIIIIHIAVITKQCFVLGSFPFNVYFQYILSLLFATDFVLMLPSTNILRYDANDPPQTIDYVYFIVFIMCTLFLILITIRPISLLCEGKYPKLVRPIYRDYYDSEDGGWRNEQSQHEETAISAYKTQLLRVPVTNNNDDDIYGGQPVDSDNNDGDDDEDDGADISHSLIEMVSHDIILPTQEPTQFDKCFYWNLSLLFIFFIHIPIIIILSTRNISFIRIIWDLNDLNESYMGIVIDILFIIPTIYTLGIVLILLILRIFSIDNCCNNKCETSTLFWCLFSRQYFEMIAIHRGQEKNKDEYYSSLWSFKKRRKKSSDSILDGMVERKQGENDENELKQSTVPKEPPNINNLRISSLRDSFLLRNDDDDDIDEFSDRSSSKKKQKKKSKKKRNPSINSDDTQELQKWQNHQKKMDRKSKKDKKRKNSLSSKSTSKSKLKVKKKQNNNNNNDEKTANEALKIMNDSLNYESMAYLIKTSTNSADVSIDRTIDVHE